MWFVFPQIAGLGRSSTAQFYAIAGRAEAAAYDRHPLLGARLRECTQAMLGWAGERSAEQVLGPVDALKFRSSMTLFEACAADPEPFAAALDAFYAGERDAATLERLTYAGTLVSIGASERCAAA
jgi:uncharacterized protein (DUF1810 family)